MAHDEWNTGAVHLCKFNINDVWIVYKGAVSFCGKCIGSSGMSNVIIYIYENVLVPTNSF